MYGKPVSYKAVDLPEGLTGITKTEVVAPALDVPV
jgi:hypothetical protein